ncbi:hypothetical protein VSH64_19830 [Amycolatopsis rhabdoformis]|uniref:Uncharacterized protein n=1 Tax=Amycolatopsis rhabdoformis TaxID=1448059 RepID=A0ABZ1IIV0_9PSEU|nr:hypothetical protein [Amycolatopsis rhabdoformis]WSE34317.1 hypothetical protein VSH64_19830 [Amycolatopsis rhabdoformis]
MAASTLLASGALRVVPGFDNVAGVPIPGWAGTLLAVVCIIAALAVLLLIVRNRRR